MPTSSELGMTSRIVLALVGLGCSSLVAVAIQTGTNTNRALEDLRVAVSSLTTKLAVIEQRINGLPPPELLYRLEALEERIEKIEN